MNVDERQLALDCYGYGRWDAPYWFIGPEQGQGKWENSILTERANAFRELNQDGLCDCRAFHLQIKERRWHVKNDKEPHKKTPQLQPTWRSLMLALMAFQDKSTTDDEVRRDYQCEWWGSSKGETCVIELSGLPAENFGVSTKRDHDRLEADKREMIVIRQKRISHIEQKMLHFKPAFVVIYGKKQWDYWQEVADNIKKRGHSKIEFAKHPTDYFEKGEKKNQYYIDLGRKLRGESTRS